MPDRHSAGEDADEAVGTDRKASGPEPAVGHGPASSAGPASQVAVPSDRAVVASRSAKPRARRALRRILIARPVALGVLVAGSYAATALLDIPSPPTLTQLLTTEPSRQGGMFATRTIPASPAPAPLSDHDEWLPATVPWKGGRMPTEQFLDLDLPAALFMAHQETWAAAHCRYAAHPTPERPDGAVVATTASKRWNREPVRVLDLNA